jgi:FAD/FMN-containing dehydrogenase
MTHVSREALRALSAATVLPGEDGWDHARSPWNVAVDQRPRAVAVPASASEVVDVVGSARDHGLALAPQSTGHGALPRDDLEGAILVRTSGMEGVEPDLAARGGNVGIVTGIEVALVPVPEIHAGWLVWPWERSLEVLSRGSRWTETAPDEVTSVGPVLQLPPLLDIPAPLRGRQLVVVEASVPGGGDEAAELLRPLRELGPELDTFQVPPPIGLCRLHQDPETPRRSRASTVSSPRSPTPRWRPSSLRPAPVRARRACRRRSAGSAARWPRQRRAQGRCPTSRGASSGSRWGC